MAKAKDEPETPRRKHRATFARDKRRGGYLVRVVGPQAEMFAGREVPVTRANGTESAETLGRLIFSGVDDGSVIAADQGLTYALYEFEAREREQTEAEF